MHSLLRGGRVAAVALGVLIAPVAGVAQQPVRSVTLEEAIRMSLDRDPAAVAAEERIETARADQLEARGALLPSVSLNSSYANSSNQRFDQATGQLVSESYAAQAQASYELFAGGRRLAQLRRAGAELEAAEAAYRRAALPDRARDDGGVLHRRGRGGARPVRGAAAGACAAAARVRADAARGRHGDAVGRAARGAGGGARRARAGGGGVRGAERAAAARPPSASRARSSRPWRRCRRRRRPVRRSRSWSRRP